MITDFTVIIGLIFGLFGVIYPIVKDSKEHRHSSEVKKNPLTYYALAINLFITILLPGGLLTEFGQTESGDFASLYFYCKHYPHIVVYPALLFGFAGLFILRSALVLWNISKRTTIIKLSIATVCAFFALYFEMTGGYMMLFEFNREAQSAKHQFESPSVRELAQKLGIGDAFDEPMAQQYFRALAKADGKSDIAKVLRHYDPWDRFSANWKSSSRTIYFFAYWYMVFVMILGFTLLPTGFSSNSLSTDPQMSLNISGAFLVFLMWLPFRIYYNLHTKIPLFGTAIQDNYIGIILSYNYWGITLLEATPTLAITVFFIFLMLRASKFSTKKISLYIPLALSVSAIIVSAIIAATDPEMFAAIYGLTGEIKFIIFRIVIFFLIVLLTFDFLTSRVDPQGQVASK